MRTDKMKYFNNSNKRNRKRGQLTVMQAAILAVAALLVFSIFLYNSYIKMKDRMAVNSCKTSIETHGLIADSSRGDIYTDIKCPTREMTIKNLRTAKEMIAEDMHRCWYIWGKGEARYFEGDGVFCHICSIYQFGDKGQKIYGFTEYLSTTKISNIYPGEQNNGISYQDYFSGYSTPKSAQMVKNNQIIPLGGLDVMNTSQKYATIFVYASGKSNIEKVLEGNRMAVGTAGGIMVFAGTAAAVGSVYGIAGAVGAEIAAALATGATVGAANAWNPVGWVILGITGVVTAVVGGVIIYQAAFNDDYPEWVSFIAFRPYDEQSLDNLGCQKFAVNQMSNAG